MGSPVFYMAINDSFSIKIKKIDGKWSWSRNSIGYVIASDYYHVRSIVNDIKHNHPVVVIFNNTLNHVSEIHYGRLHEILHNEIRDFKK